MTVPLRHISTATGADLRQMSSGELALLRYNLRVRYANQLNSRGAGSINIGGGTIFGSATNTERTQVQNTNVSRFPAANTGTLTRSTFNYGLVRTGIPGFPTDFTNSYASYRGNGDIRQENSEDNLRSAIITETINEMRTGDEVGTYRVSINSPGTGWTNQGLFFRDTIFNNSVVNNYNLWLRTSATVPAGNTFLPLRVNADGSLQEQSKGSNSALETFLFQVLVHRLSNNDLTYNINGGGVGRGVFIDTRRTGTSIARNFINQDDYRTTATPTGGAAQFQRYTFGMN